MEKKRSTIVILGTPRTLEGPLGTWTLGNSRHLSTPVLAHLGTQGMKAL